MVSTARVDVCRSRGSRETKGGKSAMVAGQVGNDFLLGGNDCRSKSALVAAELDSVELDPRTRHREQPVTCGDAVPRRVGTTEREWDELKVSHVVERPSFEPLSSSAHDSARLCFAARGGTGGFSAPEVGVHLSAPLPGSTAHFPTETLGNRVERAPRPCTPDKHSWETCRISLGIPDRSPAEPPGGGR